MCNITNDEIHLLGACIYIELLRKYQKKRE